MKGKRSDFFDKKMTTGNGAINRITYSVYGTTYKVCSYWLLQDHVTSNK